MDEIWLFSGSRYSDVFQLLGGGGGGGEKNGGMGTSSVNTHARAK